MLGANEIVQLNAVKLWSLMLATPLTLEWLKGQGHNDGPFERIVYVKI